ncbi:DUF2809 domain-containing protein [Parvularcula maris]|uniref:DUF2809 domain-containing protein n=1 Tax=Parvularcula maris TaxID=2965077 RepID=A0A9X2L6R5_9PROT|nr:DUF2809 domain-containing protein [Parvularcula maris]MCQ8184090.1 DUF2809 domain-containing protein [Parvularcula maris]
MKRAFYLLTAALLAVVLAGIAVFGEGIVRTHGGDVLVVVWMYLVLRALFLLPKSTTALMALVIAFAVEVGQLFDLAGLLGLAETRGGRLALGSTFDILDLLAYSVGALLAVLLDRTKDQA